MKIQKGEHLHLQEILIRPEIMARSLTPKVPLRDRLEIILDQIPLKNPLPPRQITHQMEHQNVLVWRTQPNKRQLIIES